MTGNHSERIIIPNPNSFHSDTSFLGRLPIHGLSINQNSFLRWISAPPSHELDVLHLNDGDFVVIPDHEAHRTFLEESLYVNASSALSTQQSSLPRLTFSKRYSRLDHRRENRQTGRLVARPDESTHVDTPSITFTEPDEEIHQISITYISQQQRERNPPVTKILMAGYIAKEFPAEAESRAEVSKRIPPTESPWYLDVPTNKDVWLARKETRQAIKQRTRGTQSCERSIRRARPNSWTL